MTNHTVTKRRAEKILELVKEQHAFYLTEIVCDDGEVLTPITSEQPSLRMDWDWPGEPTPTILWEAGPYDWTMYFPHGGRTEEGVTLPDVSKKMGKIVHAEPYSGYALCLYPN